MCYINDKRIANILFRKKRQNNILYIMVVVVWCAVGDR